MSLSEIVAVIDDPKTEAAIITTISESGDITKFGLGHGDEKIVIQLAAAALRETASEADSGEEEFIKSVLREYKTQKRAEDTV